MRLRFAGLFLMGALLSLAAAGVALAWQEHSHEHVAGKAVTVTGQVVDTACFLGHDTKGASHVKCAEMCARAGNPLAIYDEAAKTIYLPVAVDHTNPNTKLMAFIEKQVRVTGTLVDKAGLKGLVISKVEAVK